MYILKLPVISQSNNCNTTHDYWIYIGRFRGGENVRQSLENADPDRTIRVSGINKTTTIKLLFPLAARTAYFPVDEVLQKYPLKMLK